MIVPQDPEPSISPGDSADVAMSIKIYYAAPTKLCPSGDYTPTLIVKKGTTLQNTMNKALPPLPAHYASEYRYWKIPAHHAPLQGWYFPVNDFGNGTKFDLPILSTSPAFRDGDAIVIEPKLSRGWLSSFSKDFTPPPTLPRFMSL